MGDVQPEEDQNTLDNLPNKQIFEKFKCNTNDGCLLRLPIKPEKHFECGVDVLK